MFRSSPDAPSWRAAISARWPDAWRRVGPIALTLAIEAILLLMLLTLGVGGGNKDDAGPTVTTFDAAAEDAPEPAPEPSQADPREAAPLQPAPSVEVPAPAAVVTPAIALPRAATVPAAAPAPPEDVPPTPAPPKIRAVIRSDMAGNRGPADPGMPGDSERIAGSGPNGEPLYAAKWYREPTDEDFRGYFSRVTGPGWALINCRTEPEFRVDRCVLVDEWPDRSGIGSAVLAAAWQFRVRPPRVGGRSMVGEWVRIRIDYTIKRQ